MSSPLRFSHLPRPLMQVVQQLHVGRAVRVQSQPAAAVANTAEALPPHAGTQHRVRWRGTCVCVMSTARFACTASSLFPPSIHSGVSLSDEQAAAIAAADESDAAIPQVTAPPEEAVASDVTDHSSTSPVPRV